MDLGTKMASMELEDIEMEDIVNGVENGERGVLRGNKLQRNSIGSNFKRVDSFDLESSRVTGMASHGSNLLTIASILQLAFQSIGVIYGDIGTSPLYLFASTFPDGIYHPDDVLVGTSALYSLICRHAKVSVVPNQQAEDTELSTYKLVTPGRELKRALKKKEALEKSNAAKTTLLILTVLGAFMVIRDGLLNPFISTLERIHTVDKSPSQEVVAMITVAILFVLFYVQRFGTQTVGYTFAPVVLIWYLFIALIGIYNIAQHGTSVFQSFHPKYIFYYFRRNSKQGWISLGGIVLCITGTEAMFTDLGHFSIHSIQIAFTGIVYPSLICTYLGQAAYLRKFPENVADTFYKSTPSAIHWPMFVVAIVAAIIASQAIISSTFSIIKRSISLGCFLRVAVVHTSSKYKGQLYIPEINYILMVVCVVVTACFKDKTKTGNAYGIAVVGVMIGTSGFLTLVMLMIWQTRLFLVVIFITLFGTMEFIYFSAMLYKFPHGGCLH